MHFSVGWEANITVMLTAVSMPACRAAVMVGLAQIEGKHVANKVVILPAEDGSSIGAACLASAAKAFAARR